MLLIRYYYHFIFLRLLYEHTQTKDTHKNKVNVYDLNTHKNKVNVYNLNQLASLVSYITETEKKKTKTSMIDKQKKERTRKKHTHTNKKLKMPQHHNSSNGS